MNQKVGIGIEGIVQRDRWSDFFWGGKLGESHVI